MELNKHPIWEVFPVANNFENFQKNFLQPIHFKQDVPNDIQDFASSALKLLIHSYFEYDFIDIALTHAIFAFEKALRNRWKEIHGRSTKQPLIKLIDWFCDNGFFETRNNSFPQQLRLIRNGKAHDEKTTKGGIVFLQSVYKTLDLINDLYEDPTLRSIRKSETYSLTDKLSKLTMQGVVLSHNDSKLLIFAAYPVFINNKIHTIYKNVDKL